MQGLAGVLSGEALRNSTVSCAERPKRKLVPCTERAPGASTRWTVCLLLGGWIVAVDDTYRVTINAAGQSSVYQNTFAVRMESEPDPTAANFITLVTDWLTCFKPGQILTYVYTDWQATQLWGSGMTIDSPNCIRLGGRQLGAVLTGQAGTNGADGLPPQAAMVVTWITGFTGRRKRGRAYVGGQSEANQVEGQWIGTYQTTQAAALAVFLGKYASPSGTDPTFTLGVWSERTASGCVPATPPSTGHVQIDTPHPELAFTPVTSAVMRPVVYNQRRRTRGVGR